MEKTVGYISKPALIQDGQAAMCILRPPSAKDLLNKKKKTAAEVVPLGDKSTTTSESEASAVSSTDTTEGSLQQ